MALTLFQDYRLVILYNVPQLGFAVPTCLDIGFSSLTEECISFHPRRIHCFNFLITNDILSAGLNRLLSGSSLSPPSGHLLLLQSAVPCRCSSHSTWALLPPPPVWMGFPPLTWLLSVCTGWSHCTKALITPLGLWLLKPAPLLGYPRLLPNTKATAFATL